MVPLEPFYELRPSLFHPDFRLPIEVPHGVGNVGRSFRHVSRRTRLELDVSRFAQGVLELRDEVADILAACGREIVEAVAGLASRAVENGQRARDDVVDVAEI